VPEEVNVFGISETGRSNNPTAVSSTIKCGFRNGETAHTCWDTGNSYVVNKTESLDKAGGYDPSSEPRQAITAKIKHTVTDNSKTKPSFRRELTSKDANIYELGFSNYNFGFKSDGSDFWPKAELQKNCSGIGGEHKLFYQPVKTGLNFKYIADDILKSKAEIKVSKLTKWQNAGLNITVNQLNQHSIMSTEIIATYRIYKYRSSVPILDVTIEECSEVKIDGFTVDFSKAKEASKEWFNDDKKEQVLIYGLTPSIYTKEGVVDLRENISSAKSNSMTEVTIECRQPQCSENIKKTIFLDLKSARNTYDIKQKEIAKAKKERLKEIDRIAKHHELERIKWEKEEEIAKIKQDKIAKIKQEEEEKRIVSEKKIKKQKQKQKQNLAKKKSILLPASSGTGFAISKKGYILTNNHVINGCQALNIHLNGGLVSAKLIAHDPVNDLALLKADFIPKTIFYLNPNTPKLLDDIYVAGYPFGFAVSNSIKVTKGIVSSLTGIGNNFSNMQIDAAIQPGNSGGPVLDMKGNVVGIAVSKLNMKIVFKDFGVIPENTNFAIKSSIAKNFAESNNIHLNTKRSNNKKDLGDYISDGTYYLSCMMTMAKIKEMQTQKVFFQNIK